MGANNSSPIDADHVSRPPNGPKTADEKLPHPPDTPQPVQQKHVPPTPDKPSNKSNLKSLSLSFDPYDYGKADGIGWFGAMVHIIRLTIGSGILMMPYAMKELGWAMGTVLIVFSGLLYYHNLHTLIATEYRLCRLLRVERLSFIGVIDRTFERTPYPFNKFGPLVRYVTYFYFISPTALATYLIVLSSNIQLLAAYFDVALNRTYIVSVVVVPLAAFCMVRRILNALVPFSSVTNAFTFVMAGVLVVCSMVYGNASAAPVAFGDPLFAPKGFAIFILAIRCTGIVLPVKNNMRQPKRFSDRCGSLNVSGAAIVLIYYTFALVAYLNYGDDLDDNILHNLPKKHPISCAIYLLYTAALSVTYILSFFVCFDCMWSSQLEAYLKPGPCKTALEYGIRIGINAAGYVLAVAVPQISLIAALAGTVGILVEIALPPLLELLLLVGDKRKSCFVVLKNLFILMVSAALFCMSAARCVSDLGKLYANWR